jgi:PAS domain S-box-containing protein
MTSERRALPLWVTLGLLIVLSLVLFGGRWLFMTRQQQEREGVVERLEAVSNLRVDQIESWRQDQIDDARVLVSSDHTRPLLAKAFLADSEDPDKGLIEMARFYAMTNDLEDIALVRADGEGVWSLSGEAHDSAEVYAALQSAIRLGEPTMTDLHADEAGADAHITVVVPIPAAASGPPVYPGALAQVTRVSKSLYPILARWPTPSVTAESLLVTPSGVQVMVLGAARSGSGEFKRERIPLGRTDVVEVAATTHVGIVEGRDRHESDVIAYVRRVDETPWSVVSKIDTSEAYSDWRLEAGLILSSVIAFVLVVAVAWFAAWRNARHAHFQELYVAGVERRETAERYRITLDAIGDAVIATDASGAVTFVNPVAEELSGWGGTDGIGRPAKEIIRLIDEATREDLPNPIDRVLQYGIAADIGSKALLVARDGSERPIADSCTPISGSDGEVIGAVLVFRDQTEDRLLRGMNQARLQLAEYSGSHSLEQLLAKTIEILGRLAASPVVHFAFVTDGDQVVDSARWIEATSDEGVAADSRHELEYGRALSDCLRLRSTVIRNEASAGFTRAMIVPVLRDDEVVAVLAIAEKRTDYSGSDAEVVSSVADAMWAMVERKKSEEEKAKLESNLAQSHKMESVGRLAGGVAHDFNNMLGVILGHAEMAMERVGTTGEVVDDLREIRVAAERSADLTRQLLAFARRQTIVPRVVDLNTVVERALSMLRRLIGENVRVEWLPDSRLWPVRVDPTQMDQVLTNLCVNARDAIAGSGEITIETQNVVVDQAYCSVRPECRPGEYVMLSVSDDGGGMDSDVLLHVFEPFFTTKSAAEGTGLGLATVHGIINQNDGIVSVYSEPGLGTTFRVYLPREFGDIEHAADQDSNHVLWGEGRTILLVEDEPAILATTIAMLEHQGYRVIPAGGPIEAIDIATSHREPIDLLITDVVMPHMNGRDLAREIKATHPELECLFMSGYTADVIAHRGVLDAGVHFVPKPFSLIQLSTAIGKALGLASRPGEPGVAERRLAEPGEIPGPRATGEADARTEPEVPQVPESSLAPTVGPTVLVVEDEPSLLYFARFALERSGYRVLPATTPSEALSVVEDEGAIDLLFTDITLPEMSGVELAERMGVLIPGLRLLFASGHSRESLPDRSGGGRPTHFLHKPYSIEELISAVEQAIAEE